MISHIVLVRFRADVENDTKAAIFADLGRLGDRLPGLTGFAGGRNVSPEGLGRGYEDGFVVSFADAAARDAYLVDPEHQKIGARLVAAAEGGIDGILVFDLDA